MTLDEMDAAGEHLKDIVIATMRSRPAPKAGKDSRDEASALNAACGAIDLLVSAFKNLQRLADAQEHHSGR